MTPKDGAKPNTISEDTIVRGELGTFVRQLKQQDGSGVEVCAEKVTGAALLAHT